MSPQPSANGFSVVVDDQDPVESAERVMAFAKALLETAKQVLRPLDFFVIVAAYQLLFHIFLHCHVHHALPC